MKDNTRAAAAFKWASVLLAFSFVIPLMSVTGTTAPESYLGIIGPQPAYFNSTAEIESILFSIDEPLLAKHIQALQDFGTRYSYRGDRCYEAAEHIDSVFRSNGLATYYDDFVYNRWKMRNVIGVKPGVSDSNGTVIICGHYDSISPGSYPWTVAPGADDNGSGTAAVMAAAEILSDYEFNLTIKFIAFSGEELGLRGSYNYVSGAVAEGENITAVINLDMIAYNPDPGAMTVRMYEGAYGNSSWLKSFVSDTAARYGQIINMEPIDYDRNGRSDHHPFSNYYQAIMLIEQKYTSNPNYHKITDTLDYLNLTYAANITQLAIASVAELAGICSPDIAPPAHTPGTPPPGYGIATPSISLDITDPGGIDLSSVSFMVDGVPVEPLMAEIPLGLNLSYAPATPFPDGKLVNITVSAADFLGNNFTHNWSFTVDAVPPEPPTDFTVTASRIALNKRGTVLDKGSPSDMKHAVAPSVIYHEGEYKMWYMASNSTQYHINYANSTDGINWEKHGTVLLYSDVGQPDSSHVGHPSVLFDGEYRMWYSGSDGTWRIFYANSTDGINWTKHGVALDLGFPGSLDDSHLFAASVVKTDVYRMWYTGTDGLKYSILHANSTDGLNWVRHNAILLPPGGAGKRWGDAIIAYPSVVHDNGTFRMWYNRVGQNYFRTHYAESHDGLDWNDHGLAIGAGVDIGTHDRYQATFPSALVMENETKVWYSGYDGSNYRILFANITSLDPATDIALSWTPSVSTDVVRYEIFRENRPSAFRQPLETAHPESHAPPDGLTPWTFEKAAETNITVYGPVAGSDPPYFHLPDDNIIDISLCMDTSAGEWLKLVQDSDFTIDMALGLVNILTQEFGSGCTLYAWYNHSAGRALRAYGTSVTDPGAGADGADYYYTIRAVDRAGNHAYAAGMPGKVGFRVSQSWNLLGFPFLDAPTPVEEALATMDWTTARTWDPEKLPNHWTINMPGQFSQFNTLHTIDNTHGVWVRATSSGYSSVVGNPSNISVNLVAGWNLVAYPYIEIMSVSNALAGIPWDRAEAFDAASPSFLRELAPDDMLIPGQGLWVRVTSDAVWNAVNVP